MVLAKRSRTTVPLSLCINWRRIHGSLRVTLAMEAGITDHVWTISEVLTNAAS
jgi:hypothetical protein